MIYAVIKCDKCGQDAAPFEFNAGRWRAHKARAVAKKLGWSVGLPGGRDVCAWCLNPPEIPPWLKKYSGLVDEEE